MPLSGRALQHHGKDRLARLVGEHELRPKQVRSSELPAAHVDAVARAARDRVDCPAAFDERRIAGGTLLLRENAAPALTAASRRLRWRLRGRGRRLLLFDPASAATNVMPATNAVRMPRRIAGARLPYEGNADAMGRRLPQGRTAYFPPGRASFQ